MPKRLTQPTNEGKKVDYFLQANHYNKADSRLIEANSDEQAILEASFLVMELAVNDPTWSQGAIALRNNAGQVIQSMPAKS